MIDFNAFWFSNTTAEDQINCFSGEFGYFEYGQVGDYAHIESGTYRVVDGKLFQITQELTNELMGQ